jgi:hypothetical protein
MKDTHNDANNNEDAEEYKSKHMMVGNRKEY